MALRSNRPLRRGRKLLVSLIALTTGVTATACSSGSDDGEADPAPTSTAGESTPDATALPDTAPVGSDPTSVDSSPTTGSVEGSEVEPSATDLLTFVDDRGEEITFDEPPTRVVAWQAIVPALVELGIEPVGVIAFNDIATNPAFIDAGVDVDGLTAVSTSYGEVDIEALAALEPDLILTYTFGGEFLQGFTDGNTEELAGRVAPFVVMDANAPVLDGIERMEELAVVLGADLESDANQESVAAFDDAVGALTDLARAEPGLTAAFGGPNPEGLFVAPVESYPELQFYEELGLDVLSGTQDSVVSWELVDGIDADVFLVDDRTTQPELDEADSIATWPVIPAVAAGQYSATWRFLLSYSRADYARSINRMLPTLQEADPDVV